MSQALYRKWRSHTFADLVGQPHVVRTLENALQSDRVAHAYLFNGPRGTGKTSTARLLAKALNCIGPKALKPCGECTACQAIDEGRYLDLVEIDAASNNGVEDIRELRNAVNFSPTVGDSKVYIVDEVHMLSPSAFNALLKTLEEPPNHVYFILATTEIHRIPATVISRCQRFDFRRIPTGEIQNHLKMISNEEGCIVESAALSMIAESAQGGMRDAISLLDQVIGLGQGNVNLKQVQDLLGLTDIQAINTFVGAIVAEDKAQGLEVLQDVVLQGGSISEFLQQTIMQLRAAFRFKLIGGAQVAADMPTEQAAILATWAKACSENRLLHAMSVMVDAAADLRQAPHPQILVELALITAINGPSQLRVDPVQTAAQRQQSVPIAKTERSAVQPPQESASTSSRPRQESSVGLAEPSASDEDERDILRDKWRDLQRTVRERARDNKAHEALTTKGLVDLYVVDGIVTFILRDAVYRSALNKERNVLNRKFRDYLGREVKCKLLTARDSPIALSSKAVSESLDSSQLDPDPLQIADTFLRKEKGATLMEEAEQQDLLAQLDKGKD